LPAGALLVAATEGDSAAWCTSVAAVYQSPAGYWYTVIN